MLHELTAGEAGLLVLFPHLAGLDLVHVEDLGGGVRITAGTRTASLACRGCGVVSARVHDRYERCLAGLACLADMDPPPGPSSPHRPHPHPPGPARSPGGS